MGYEAARAMPHALWLPAGGDFCILRAPAPPRAAGRRVSRRRAAWRGGGGGGKGRVKLKGGEGADASSRDPAGSRPAGASAVLTQAQGFRARRREPAARLAPPYR